MSQTTDHDHAVKISQSTYIVRNKYTYINVKVGSDEEWSHDEVRKEPP